MRRAVAGLVAALLMSALAPGVPGAAARERGALAKLRSAARNQGLDRPLPRWVPGRVLVQFRRGVDRARASSWLAARTARVTARIPAFGVDVVRLPDQQSVAEAVARFEASPLVRAAQPDLYLQPLEVPNDQRFPDQWALRNVGQRHPVTFVPGGSAGRARGKAGADIRATKAWDTQKGSRRAVIAVLDSGVDVDHPDLASRIWNNPGEVPGDGKDNDRNGFVDDIHGWDFAENDDTLLHPVQSVFAADHGTHVAGIAAAASGDARGTAGVCPGCKIMVLKFMRAADVNGDGRKEMVGTQSAELRALAYARANGADIVNGSFGGALWSGVERRAFGKLGKSGVLSVLAAGNENGDNDMYLTLYFNNDNVVDSLSPAYPASYDLGSILSVAASNHRDQYGSSTACSLRTGNPRWPCAFTNWGHDSVDVAAPGVDILSTIPGGDYDTFDGTSMAAPHVAGVAGLVLSQHPRYSPKQLKNAIMSSVDRPVSLRNLYAFPRVKVRRGGFTRTGGRVNANAALAASARPRYPRTDGNIAGARQMKEVARGRVSWPRDTNDVYKKRLVKGRRYKAVLTGPRGKNLDLVAYKPGAKEIWQFELGCYGVAGRCSAVFYKATGSAGESARFRARRSGNYVFQVSSYFSTGRYTLRVKRA
ncbi:hypothetical protein BH24ACT26_BH24ACT26_20300 [soil metagenome]